MSDFNPASQNSQIAINFGETMAQTLFNDMLNTAFQGPKFQWENFPQMFVKVCQASLFTHYPETPNNIKELEIVAAQALMEKGQSLKKDYLQTHNTLPLNQ